ncbi:MAG: lipid-A-disaccharide synthase [Prevotella sp.]|nr:lipid-A-disaccharide synthase [Prevotella sp.]MBR5748570.1 lipid-A-disaccharide synthase [Prevotella sp.]
MRYYLIVGEASGDLHASHLMQSLKNLDTDAEFRFFGGDMMKAVGGTCVRHYRDLAYMGFVPVLLHLSTIISNMRMCKDDIISWQPDCVILVDYPGFNLKIARFVKSRTNFPVYYYISPKIWAWKEYRIKNIKRDVDELFSILPFEVDFFEGKHHYPVHYVGNPTADEVRQFLTCNHPDNLKFSVSPAQPIIALLAGSRKQEIKDNLPAMLEAVKPYEDYYQIILAAAPGIEADYYAPFVKGRKVQVIYNQTYALLSQAHTALVTSGTATLEACLFRVPQVVCYKLPLPVIADYLRRRLLKVKYISLVNLIADREVVTELLGRTFTVDNIRAELDKILEGPARETMLECYDEVSRRLGDQIAPVNAASLIIKKLNK